MPSLKKHGINRLHPPQQQYTDTVLMSERHTVCLAGQEQTCSQTRSQ